MSAAKRDMKSRTESPRVIAGAGAIAFLLASSAGCSSPMDRVELKLQTTPPVDIAMSGDRIQIDHGIGAGVLVVPIADGSETSTSVTMTSSDTTIFGAERVTGNFYIVYGTFPGECTARIVEDSTGAQVDVPVAVVTQP